MSSNKIVFVGNARTGKSYSLHRLLSSPLPNAYNPTEGATVSVFANKYDIWDTAGAKEHAGLRDGYYVGAKAFVIFGPINDWYKDVTRVCPDARVHFYNNHASLKRFICGLDE